MPSTRMPLDADPGFVSEVATAKIAADLASAMNRIPSGPKATWEMVLMSGLPSAMPSVQLPAWVEAARRLKVAAKERARGMTDFIIVSFPFRAGCLPRSRYRSEERRV